MRTLLLKIEIEVDGDEKHCGNCKWLAPDTSRSGLPCCDLPFFMAVLELGVEGRPLRCKDCLKAEIGK